MKARKKQASAQLGLLARLETVYTRRLTLVRVGIAERRDDLTSAYRWAYEQNLQIINDIYKETIPSFGRLVYDGLKGANSYETKRSAGFWQSLVDKWLRINGLTQASNITQTAIDDAREILIERVAEGQGEYSAARALRDYAGISKERARVIARTEVHGAAMYATKETAVDYQQLTGLTMKKTWDATLDARTRKDHAAVNGQKKSMDEKFMVGGYAMDRPGDPAGGAGNVINCRCVLTFSDNFDDLE